MKIKYLNMSFRQETRETIRKLQEVIASLENQIIRLEDNVHALNNPFKFKIGDKVVDIATGRKGEVVNMERKKFYHLSGYTRLSHYLVYFDQGNPPVVIYESTLKLIENEEGTNRDNISQNTGKPKTTQHSSKRG